MQMVTADIFPGQKADSADDDKCHDDQVDQWVCGIKCEGRKGNTDPHQVDPCVAEGGNGMEHGHPESADEAKISAKYRGQQSGTGQLDQERSPDDKAGQAHNAAHLWCGHGFLHGTALHQTDLASGNNGDCRSDSYDSHAANLDQHQDHSLTENGPVGTGIHHDQTRHADRGGGGE